MLEVSGNMRSDQGRLDCDMLAGHMAHVHTRVDLNRIRTNAIRISEKTAVPLIAVLKADAYGHGAVAVAEAIHDLVEGWYVFTPQEAIEVRLYERTGKRSLAGNVPADAEVELLARHGVRPAVWTVETASRFAALDPILAVDTGMQRFACPEESLDAVFAAYAFTEAFTHASKPEQALKLVELTKGRTLKRHAAATALLGDERCRLDAVRPGFALFAGAATVTAPLIDARDERGPVGYTAFHSPTHRHGVIHAGYSNGLRHGPVLINGRPQKIIEIGMQSAYVSLDREDKTGDEVVLLGDSLTAVDVAAAWGTSPQQAMLTLAAMGEKRYA